jgi:hypothetical protein
MLTTAAAEMSTACLRSLHEYFIFPTAIIQMIQNLQQLRKTKKTLVMMLRIS